MQRVACPQLPSSFRYFQLQIVDDCLFLRLGDFELLSCGTARWCCWTWLVVKHFRLSFQNSGRHLERVEVTTLRGVAC